MRRPRGDDGNAMVEFTYLAVLLMVPLVYILISAFQVQRSSFGVTEAARQAGRAYTTAPNTTVALDRARAASRLALSDQGVADEPEVDISCDGPCLAPGTTVTVTVRHVVRLPALSVLGSAAPTIPVSATHDEVVDVYSEAAP